MLKPGLKVRLERSQFENSLTWEGVPLPLDPIPRRLVGWGKVILRGGGGIRALCA